MDQSASVHPIENRRILAVENDEISQLLLRRFIANLGGHLSIASSGEEALALALQIKFDLVLMDIHLPVMDGFTTTQALRKLSKHYQLTPIIGLIASLPGELEEKMVHAGIDDVRSKAYSLNDFEAMLIKHLGNSHHYLLKGASHFAPNNSTLHFLQSRA